MIQISELYAKDRFFRGNCLGDLMMLEIMERWDES